MGIFSHLEYFLNRLEKKNLKKGREMGEDRRISIKREKWNPKLAASTAEEFAFHKNVKSDLNFDVTVKLYKLDANSAVHNANAQIKIYEKRLDDYDAKMMASRPLSKRRMSVGKYHQEKKVLVYRTHEKLIDDNEIILEETFDRIENYCKNIPTG